MQLLQKATVPEDPADACAAELIESVPRIMQCIRTVAPSPSKGELTVQQFRALGFLRAYPGASLSDVATYFGLTMPATSRLIDGLVQRRLVTRSSTPHNRRQLRLFIRPQGHKLLRSAIRITQQRLRDRLTDLPPERLNQIAESLRDLSTQLTTTRP